MKEKYARAIRCLIAMQVAVLEHHDEDLSEDKAVHALNELDKEWKQSLKALKHP